MERLRMWQRAALDDGGRQISSTRGYRAVASPSEEYDDTLETPLVGEDGTSSDIDSDGNEWTIEEETKLVRKVDMLVMPLLIIGFFALQMDRGNIGNALTDYFLRDVHITQFQFNVGQQLMCLGIVLLEIPSNIILYRIGPAVWIGSQIIAWGSVATLQAFQSGLWSFLSTRLLLGICEAGFIPAGLYTITRWYTSDETSKRFSWFFVGNMTAAASSGVIAYFILHMRGTFGLAGWQWLFILEGIASVCVGILFLCVFPQSASKPVSVLGFRYFTEREARILTRRVLQDDPSKMHTQTHVSPGEIMSAVTNWRLVPHIILTLCGLAPSSTMVAYAPTLVASYGFDRLASNALASVGFLSLMALNLIMGFMADRLGRRGPIVMVGMFVFWLFAIANRIFTTSKSEAWRYLILIITIAVSSPWHPVNGSWMALNAKSAGERSVTMAILIMAANSAGLIGNQLFQAGDAPLYQTGWSLIILLVFVALLASVATSVQYHVLNRQRPHGMMYKH